MTFTDAELDTFIKIHLSVMDKQLATMSCAT